MAIYQRTTHPICKALNECDYNTVRTFCMEMLDHELSEHEAAVLFARWKGRQRKTLWDTACGHVIWIKNRLMELRALDAPHNPPTDFDELATAVLHCFFMSLEETAEMIAMLHNEDLATSEQRKKPARSKMFSTPLAVEPIDAIAGAVAPVHERKT